MLGMVYLEWVPSHCSSSSAQNPCIILLARPTYEKSKYLTHRHIYPLDLALAQKKPVSRGVLLRWGSPTSTVRRQRSDVGSLYGQRWPMVAPSNRVLYPDLGVEF